MRKIIGVCLLASALFAPGAYAQDVYKNETIVGIGATLEKLADGTVQVDALIPNAPAERAGVLVGDVIVEVKSLPSAAVADVRGLPLTEIVALIRGPVGVPVEITLARKNSELTTLLVVREKIEFSDDE